MKGVSPLCIGDPEKLPGHVRCVGGRTANWDFSVFPQCVFSTILLLTIKYAFVWEVDVLNRVVADTCSIRHVPWKYRNVVFYARKDYPYLEILNHR